MLEPENSASTERHFFERIAHRQSAIDSLLCIGIDPDRRRIPACCGSDETAIFAFCKAIVDATAEVASCYKPQVAYFSAEGAEDAMQEIIRYIKDLGIPVLLDAKRGDISSTAEMYAREMFERYEADAATVNPYMGIDSMQPYIDYPTKGVFILCRTSNPGGMDLQQLKLEGGKSLYETVAYKATHEWNSSGNIGLVVGATRPAELQSIRNICGEMTLLLPGVGVQGADISKVMRAGQGGGMLISSSRAIIYAGQKDDFADAARQAAIEIRNEINRRRIA